MTVRAAIRRTLGTALTLIAVSVGLFWASVTYGRHSPSPALRASPFAALPVFFNARPIDVRQLAERAVRQIAHGGAAVPGAELSLARLGGAALPYVLPALDTLEPRTRERVALALTPIALRMGLATPDDLADGAQAALFWARFWQDRAIDFRADRMRRLSERLAEQSIALRREDLIHVDTFALPSLIDALGKVVDGADVARVERLSSVISHVTDLPERRVVRGSVVEAQHTVDTWHDFWAIHGSEYSVIAGPRRLTAMFVQTQYGKWLAATLHGGLGRTQTGQSAWSEIESGAAVTAFLLIVGLGGGFSLGVAWARFERRLRRPAGRSLSALAGTALAVVPCATAVALTGHRAGFAGAACLVTLGTAGWVARHLARSAMNDDASASLALVVSAAFPLGATYPPLALSAIVLVELGFGLKGVGGEAAESLASGDVNAWMATSLALALATLLLRQAADLLRPPLANEAEPVGGAS